MTVKYFLYPFGVDGDRGALPNPTQPAGTVSWQAGFPIGYQLVDTDPASINIPRLQFNQMMFDTTAAIQQIQQNGFPVFITSAMNGGSPYPYLKNSYVRAADGNVYYSLIDTNTDTPPTANWQLAGAEVSQYFNFAVDTGIADHYVIAPSPDIVSYADGDIVNLRPIHANTGACDIDVNGLGPISIKTMTNQDPSAGMLIPTGAYLLEYFGGVFVLLNPTLGTAAYKNTGAANGDLFPLDIVATSATNGYEVRGPITYQWGMGTSIDSGSGAVNLFNTPFGDVPFHVSFTTIKISQTTFTTGERPAFATNTWTTTGFKALGDDGLQPMSWFAIGPT